MGLELVLSPDTSLNEHTSIIGMMSRAKSTLYVEQNSIRRRWGRKADSSAPEPWLYTKMNIVVIATTLSANAPTLSKRAR